MRGPDSRRPTVPGTRLFSSLLRYPSFRLLWFSNLFFFGGAWTQTLILGWLVYDRTGSELLLAVFTAARLAPMMLGPISGVVSDRHHRPTLLLVAAGWAFVAVAVVAALASTGHLPYWGIVVGGLCIGLAQSPSQPARSTLVMDLVGRENLSNANALNSIVMNMTQIVGPAAGGVLISALGASTALWVSALWFLLSWLLLWPLRKVGSASAAVPASVAHRRPGESIWESLVGGLRAVMTNRLAAAALLVTLAANLTLWPLYQSFMPVFARDLGLDATGLGWLLTCGGLGGLAGSLVIAALGDFRFKGGFFVVGTAIWGVLWTAFALSRSVPLSFVLLGLGGLASSAFGVLQTTLLLMMTEPAVRGRVLGLQELTIGVLPLATMVQGATASLFGVRATAFVGALSLVVFLLALGARTPDLLRYSGADRPNSAPATHHLRTGSAPAPVYDRE
ncbi:Predicted arabinose efflux permease, MFS family [Actinopolymorpha singaporensis]|uniref:Predicted arabinose efflux permease, MFS family n=1 Tax=Actinopolymorpha singaporensis TaxID=117157 RepID=A0A1H1TSG4_9ACTN|nr:Predicted arabinose efflux permease, MFS family [Actinopolymorpha singaporensis]